MNTLTFDDGLPVPDGIPYSEISESIYPSNISVITADDLDVAYICPRGSVLFVVGSDAGYNNALIHSPPNLPALDNHDLQRELIVADCFMSP